MADTKTKNPALGFLIMAGFNLLASIVFLVFYFPYDSRGGENSYFLLVASIVSFAASIGLLVVYNVFRNKFRNIS
jgi:hypothetical protein